MEKEISAIPRYRAKGSRVRMEVVPHLKGLKRKRHDICIFKEGIIESEETSSIESIIEVKHGYHYSAGQVTNKDAIGKDLRILAHYYKKEDTEAFLVYFMGNEIKQQTEKQIQKYEDGLKEGLRSNTLTEEEINEICENNILMVFLDKVVNGNMREVK